MQTLKNEVLSRRKFMRLSALGAGSVLAAGCQPKVVEKIVKETVVVKKAVKETVVVKEAVEVEKEVTRVVEKQVEVEKAAKEPVELRCLYPDWSTLTIIPNLSQELSERRDGISIKAEPLPGGPVEITQKVLMQHASGDIVDLFWCNVWNAMPQLFIHKGVTQVVNDRVDAEAYPLDEFFPRAFDACSYEGKFSGLPHFGNFGCSCLIYNAEIFEEAGVDEPTLDWTYDDAMEAMTKTTLDTDNDGRTDIFGWRCQKGYQTLMSILIAYGGPRMLSDDGRESMLDCDEMREVCKFWLDAIHVAKAAPPPGSDGGGSFLGGTQAMQRVYTGHGLAWQPLLIDGFKFGFTLAPKGPRGDRGGVLCSDFLMMTALGKHQEETWEAIKFYCSEEVGIRRTLMGSGDPGARPACWRSPQIKKAFPWWKDEFVEAFENAPAEVPAWNLRGGEVSAAYNAHIDDILLQAVTVDEGIDAMVQEMNDVLAMPMAD